MKKFLKTFAVILLVGVAAGQVMHWTMYALKHRDGHGPLTAGAAMLAAYKLCLVKYDTGILEYYIERYQSETGIENKSTALRSFYRMRDAIADRAIEVDEVKSFCNGVQEVNKSMENMQANKGT